AVGIPQLIIRRHGQRAVRDRPRRRFARGIGQRPGAVAGFFERCEALVLLAAADVADVKAVVDAAAPRQRVVAAAGHHIAGETVALMHFERFVVALELLRIGLCLIIGIGMAAVTAVDFAGIDDRDVIVLDQDTDRAVAR